MAKVFEDEFMDWQADMVDIAKEYIEDRAEKIYLYGSIEEGVYFFNLFFKIKNKILFMHQINSILSNSEKKFDVSQDRQETVLHIGAEDLIKIEEVCKKYGQSVPTEFKLIYDVKSNSLKAHYEYDLKYSNEEDVDTDDIFMAWYEDIKNTVENPQEFGFE